MISYTPSQLKAGYAALDAAIRHVNEQPGACEDFACAMDELRDLPESVTMCANWIRMAKLHCRVAAHGQAHMSVTDEETGETVKAAGDVLQSPVVLTQRFVVAVFNEDEATARILWGLAGKDPDLEDDMRRTVVGMAGEILAHHFPNGLSPKATS
ncbi:hypothetical protein ACWFMI_23860 [Nocardiopsis terrae]|uniref:hypothetical protein n=1 Tax=Streptomyces sp. NPDC057554 TaxID=3350538 RepID=UPI0036B328B2